MQIYKSLSQRPYSIFKQLFNIHAKSIRYRCLCCNANSVVINQPAKTRRKAKSAMEAHHKHREQRPSPKILLQSEEHKP